MKNSTRPANMSPYIDTLLSQVTDKPDLATSLLKALTNHIHYKTEELKQRIHMFESKWEMTFEEFLERTRAGKFVQNAGSSDLERDLKVWEQTEVLLKHYSSLQTQ